jgi:hypothetical protein
MAAESVMVEDTGISMKERTSVHFVYNPKVRLSLTFDEYLNSLETVCNLLPKTVPGC